MRWPWIWATFGIQTKLCQYGAVFVETETGFDSVHLQSSIDTAQAGLGKQAFEHKMAKYEMPWLLIVQMRAFLLEMFSRAKLWTMENVFGRHHQNFHFLCHQPILLDSDS